MTGSPPLITLRLHPSLIAATSRASTSSIHSAFPVFGSATNHRRALEDQKNKPRAETVPFRSHFIQPSPQKGVRYIRSIDMEAPMATANVRELHVYDNGREPSTKASSSSATKPISKGSQRDKTAYMCGKYLLLCIVVCRIQDSGWERQGQRAGERNECTVALKTCRP